jgi:hypothetical protein
MLFTPWCGGGGQKVRYSRHNLAPLDNAKQQNELEKVVVAKSLDDNQNTRLGWCGGHSCGVTGYSSKPNSL